LPEAPAAGEAAAGENNALCEGAEQESFAAHGASEDFRGLGQICLEEVRGEILRPERAFVH